MLGANIKNLRQHASMTQVGLAEAMGVSQQAVALWEAGKSAPQAVDIPKLAAVLKCSYDQLFNDKEVSQ